MYTMMFSSELVYVIYHTYSPVLVSVIDHMCDGIVYQFIV